MCSFRALITAGVENWWNKTPQKILSWKGIDGATNIDQLTSGFVNYLDLTSNLSNTHTRSYDWAMSLEVGQYIPRDFESNYLSNLVKHVKISTSGGIVISWAGPNQKGPGRTNLRLLPNNASN